MANYSITIINESGDDQDYILFQEVPKTTNVPGSEVFTNVYQAAPGISHTDNSSATFSMHKDFYAILGTSSSKLGSDVKVTTKSSVKVNLAEGSKAGDQLFVSAPNNNPRWQDDRATTQTVSGSFAIQTDVNFTFPNEHHIFVGLGAPDPNDSSSVVPAATFPAHPNMTYNIWPHVKFYVSTGQFEPGTIIDVRSLGPTLMVDFESGLPDRTYTHNSNGEYVLKQ